MPGTQPYAMERVTEERLAAVEPRVRAELAAVGFGVLTEIDVQQTLRQKIGLERPPYRILGACNPRLAARGLAAEPELGVMLPCNVCLWEEDGVTVVAAMKPTVALPSQDAEVCALAAEAERLVWTALERAVPRPLRSSGGPAATTASG